MLDLLLGGGCMEALCSAVAPWVVAQDPDGAVLLPTLEGLRNLLQAVHAKPKRQRASVPAFTDVQTQQWIARIVASHPSDAIKLEAERLVTEFL